MWTLDRVQLIEITAVEKHEQKETNVALLESYHKIILIEIRKSTSFANKPIEKQFSLRKEKDGLPNSKMWK